MNADGTDVRRLVHHGLATTFNPVWSADGRRLVYGLTNGWR